MLNIFDKAKLQGKDIERLSHDACSALWDFDYHTDGLAKAKTDDERYYHSGYILDAVCKFFTAMYELNKYKKNKKAQIQLHRIVYRLKEGQLEEMLQWTKEDKG